MADTKTLKRKPPQFGFIISPELFARKNRLSKDAHRALAAPMRKKLESLVEAAEAKG